MAVFGDGMLFWWPVGHLVPYFSLTLKKIYKKVGCPLGLAQVGERLANCRENCQPELIVSHHVAVAAAKFHALCIQF